MLLRFVSKVDFLKKITPSLSTERVMDILLTHLQSKTMVLLTFIILFILFNLFSVVTENATPYYKDIRFWLIMVSLVVLLAITIDGYPIR